MRCQYILANSEDSLDRGHRFVAQFLKLVGIGNLKLSCVEEKARRDSLLLFSLDFSGRAGENTHTSIKVRVKTPSDYGGLLVGPDRGRTHDRRGR